MRVLRRTGLALAAIVTLGMGLTNAQDAVAPETAEEAVELRSETMRSNGRTLRGAADLTGDEAVAAMQTMKTNFTNIPIYFPEGSIVGESAALPAIWEDWDTFTAIAQAGADAADAAILAAEAGDAAGYAEAVGAVSATCNQCHQQFRAD
jgi:cytochrome c556